MGDLGRLVGRERAKEGMAMFPAMVVGWLLTVCVCSIIYIVFISCVCVCVYSESGQISGAGFGVANYGKKICTTLVYFAFAFTLQGR